MATFITIKNIYHRGFRAGGVTVPPNGQAVVNIENASVHSALRRYRSYWIQLSGTPMYTFTYDFAVHTGFKTTDEVWTVTVDATGGKFKVTDGTTTTAELNFNVSTGDFQTALEAFPSIGAGKVAVTGGPGDAGGTTPYTLTFDADLGTYPVLVASTGTVTPLSGGASTAVALKTVTGHSGVYTLTAPDGPLPDNFIITQVVGEVVTAFTSAGEPVLDVGIESNDDLFYSAVAKSFFSSGVVNTQVGSFPEGDDGAFKMTAESDVTLTVTDNALTAGKLNVYVSGIPGA